MKKSNLTTAVLAGIALSLPVASQAGGVAPPAPKHFDLEASFLVCENTDCGDETSSEIIAVSADGLTLVYSDSPGETVGLIDISDPSAPAARGAIDLSAAGEPTSVALFTGVDADDNPAEYILVGINRSPGFSAVFNADHAGELQVFSLGACLAANGACLPLAVHDLEGQPDSVAVSPDGSHVAVVIENERDEEACHDASGTLFPDYWGEDNEDACEDKGYLFGRIPQPNAGELAVIRDTDASVPADWSIEKVSLVGLGGLRFDTDPEPEYVHINADNKALVSLQENNAFVIVDLTVPEVVDSFSAGKVDLVNIDTDEDDLIQLKDDESGVYREPDTVTWIGTGHFSSANEGDMDGGSRGFTIFEGDGDVVYESYESYDYLQVMHGHYPEDRSGNKGSEPEAVSYLPDFGGRELLFVGSERGNTVAVYDLADKAAPALLQLLPAVMGPESVIAIPARDLVIIANEVDDEARSMVNIYRYEEMPAGPDYPTVASVEDPTPPAGASADTLRPIPFGALSGLTAGDAPGELYAVHDSFYVEPRIYHLDASVKPALITGYTRLHGIDQDELDAYDMEGIAMRPDGGFWIVSEGSGNIDNSGGRTFRDENLLIRVAADGEVLEQIGLPEEVANKQHRFGFEGVAVTGSGDEERVYVAFQREWLLGEPEGIVRIGEYRPQSGNWKFHWYPLDPREADSGWVGLSEIVAVGERQFLVLERDNQAGPDAAIKRVYRVDLDAGRDANRQANRGKNGQGQSRPTLRKTLVRDLLPVYQAINGWVPDKPEGMTVDANGDLFVVTDNDGVDDAPGQTWLFNLGSPED
ncbi:MAG: esterase-like activity of phytase family protein [Xanthomonadales bacterium]|nr:esterase-like activity of phytase family protein [Xanthomonadales bacterium]